MSKMISQNDNGVIYVESDQGVVYGIVSGTCIIDVDGVPFDQDTLTVLDNAGFDLYESCYVNEPTYLNLDQGDGTTVRLVFIGDHVSVEAL